MFYLPSQHLAAIQRAATVLTAQFPQHIPGHQDGWRIQTRAGRPVATWDLKEKIDADTPQQATKRAELAQTLATAGLATTLPTHMYMVFFAEMPDDPTTPRYTVVHDDTFLGGLFGDPHLIMDTYTNVDVATADTPEHAEHRRVDFTIAEALTKTLAAATDRARDTTLPTLARRAMTALADVCNQLTSPDRDPSEPVPLGLISGLEDGCEALRVITPAERTTCSKHHRYAPECRICSPS